MLKICIFRSGGVGDALAAAHIALALRRRYAKLARISLSVGAGAELLRRTSPAVAHSIVQQPTVQTSGMAKRLVANGEPHVVVSAIYTPRMQLVRSLSELGADISKRILEHLSQHQRAFDAYPEAEALHREFPLSNHEWIRRREHLLSHQLRILALPSSTRIQVRTQGVSLWDFRAVTGHPYMVLTPDSGLGGTKKEYPFRASRERNMVGWLPLIHHLRDEGVRTLLLSTTSHKEWDQYSPAINLSGRTSLSEASALIAGAVFHAGPEGGMTHVAAAVGKPSLVVYGPTPPEVFGYPGHIPCAGGECLDCFWGPRWLDSSRCPRGYSMCANFPDSSHVLETGARLLTQVVGSRRGSSNQ